MLETQYVRDQYSDQLRKYIAARIEWPAVDDILQQVFLKAHQKLKTVNQDDAIKSWLYRITQHTIIDRYRKEHTWNHWTLSDQYREVLEDDSSKIKEKRVIMNIASCLLPMIDSLDDQSKQVMKRYLEPNVTQSMISEELWISVSNIKVIVHRAKKKLKEKFEQCCYTHTDKEWRIIDTRCSSNCWCDNAIIH